MINAPDMAGRNDISALPAIQWRRDMRLISIIMAIVLWLPPLFGVFNPACGRDSAPIALPTGTALPETAIAPATDVTPTEAAASIEDSSQTASPTSNPTKAPAAGGTATPTARPTATPSSRPTAASSREDIELPEIEIPVKTKPSTSTATPQPKGAGDGIGITLDDEGDIVMPSIPLS